jgi:hypothetical protein
VKSLRGGHPASFIERLAASGHDARDVSRRAQIAAGAHRTEARHDRRDAVIQQVQQAFDHHQAHGRESAGQRIRTQEDGGPYGLFRQGIAHAAGQKFEQVLLVVRKFVRRDHVARIAAETGIDSVDHFAGRQLAFERFAAAADPPAEFFVSAERDALSMPRYGDNFIQGKMFWEIQTAAVGVIRVAISIPYTTVRWCSGTSMALAPAGVNS